MPAATLQPEPATTGVPPAEAPAPSPEDDTRETSSRVGRSPVVAQTRADPAPAADRGSAIGQAWVWIGVLIAVTIIAGLALIQYRRRVLAAEAEDAGGQGILEMLRRARDRGEMTEQEFQTARKRLVGEMAARMKAPEVEGRARKG